MKKSVYYRGKTARYWYNFTESLAYALLYRPTPEELIYTKHEKYGEDKLQYINTYCRKDSLDKKKPLFIYVHGGGWISGLTDMRNTYIKNWAKLGFYTTSISYSYAPEKIFPAQLHEIFAAIDYIMDKAEENNVDCNNIVISGESAGGYYISFIAACADDPSLLDKLGINFRHRDTFKLKAMISHCGCYNLQQLTDPSKPQSKFPDVKMMISSFVGMTKKETAEFLKTENGAVYSPPITKGFPPVFITWCTQDKLRYEAFDVMKKFDELGIPYEQFKGDGIISQHAWTIVTVFKKGKLCFEKAAEFAAKYVDI